MAHVLIVGKSFSGLKKSLVANGHSYTLLQDEVTTKFPNKRFKHRLVSSFETKQSYLRAAQTIHDKKPIDATIVIYESYVVASAVIAHELGIPGMSEEAAIACTDKEMMRTKFAASKQKVSPDFHTVESRDSLIEFAHAHDFPLILKPANLSKSLLVTKNDSLEELVRNYDNATLVAPRIYKKYAPHSTPKFIVEEFLEGSIHSVDAFVDAAGEPYVLEQVVDYQTGYDIGFDDNFHYSRLLPSKLSSENIEAIRKTAKLGCQLLGMTSSPAHVEIILTKDGPRIVEIGARNGGYRERMHLYANNIDTTGNHIAVATGKQPDITASTNKACAVLELFPKQSGLFEGISNLEGLKSLSSLQYLSIKATDGQYVGKSSDGYKMCAVILLGNDNPNDMQRDLDYISSHVTVLTSDQ